MLVYKMNPCQWQESQVVNKSAMAYSNKSAPTIEKMQINHFDFVINFSIVLMEYMRTLAPEAAITGRDK